MENLKKLVNKLCSDAEDADRLMSQTEEETNDFWDRLSNDITYLERDHSDLLESAMQDLFAAKKYDYLQSRLGSLLYEGGVSTTTFILRGMKERGIKLNEMSFIYGELSGLIKKQEACDLVNLVISDFFPTHDKDVRELYRIVENAFYHGNKVDLQFFDKARKYWGPPNNPEEIFAPLYDLSVMYYPFKRRNPEMLRYLLEFLLKIGECPNYYKDDSYLDDRGAIEGLLNYMDHELIEHPIHLDQYDLDTIELFLDYSADPYQTFLYEDNEDDEPEFDEYGEYIEEPQEAIPYRTNTFNILKSTELRDTVLRLYNQRKF